MRKIVKYPHLKGKINSFYMNLLGFREIDIKKNILIFSDPRGGSTWLTQIMQQLVNAPVVWEPLDTYFNKNIRDLKFGNRQYIPENLKSQEIYNVFHDILRGRKLTYYNLKLNNLCELYHTEKFIIKFCRGALVLPWIVENFELKCKPIFMIRNPFSLVSSQLEHGSWDYKFKNFRIPTFRYDDVFTQHQTFLNTISTLEESLTVTWCVSTKYILNHKENNKKWVTIRYEDLVREPDTNMECLLRKIGLHNNNNVDLKFRDPSFTSKKLIMQNAEKRIYKWKNNLSNKQILNIRKVIKYFEMDNLYPDF